MKPEQLKWTDEQWAAHLGCAAADIPKFKDWLHENYFLGIFQEKKTRKKYIEIHRLHYTPSGAVRYIPVVSTTPESMSLKAMVTKANTQVIPSLVLNDLAAKFSKVPPKVLQMLHIEKQK